MRKPRIVGDRLLVKVKKDDIDNKYQYNKDSRMYEEIGKAGFVVARFTEKEVENMRLGTQEAHVTQIGPCAFLGLGDGNPRAALGDLVTIVRWSGEVLPDLGDGEIYKIISDEDVLLVWEGEGL